MIQSRNDLLRYLKTERLLFLHRNYGESQINRKHPRLHGENEWKYVISMRYIEYWVNVLKNLGGVQKFTFFPKLLFHRHRLKCLMKNNYILIPINVFDEGLFIQHLHNIVVSSDVSVGRYCRMFHNTTIGISVGSDKEKCPKIGNGVTICTGSVIVGDVSIADSITIGANAVVTKTIAHEGSVIGGVPAGIIKSRAAFKMAEYAEYIINKYK